MLRPCFGLKEPKGYARVKTIPFICKKQPVSGSVEERLDYGLRLNQSCVFGAGCVVEDAAEAERACVGNKKYKEDRLSGLAGLKPLCGLPPIASCELK